MTVIFLALAGGCIALLILIIAAAANHPTGGTTLGLAGPIALLAGGVPVFLVAAAVSWFMGG